MTQSNVLFFFVASILLTGCISEIIRVSDHGDVLSNPSTRHSYRAGRSFLSSVQKSTNELRSSEYGQRIVVGEDGCEFFPEVVMVQDVSYSYEDDMVNLQKLMPQLFQFFQDQFQGHVRFSVVSFVDKSIRPFGYSNDFCACVDLPLSAVSSADAVAEAQKVFQNLRVGGGNDYIEGANEAMFRAAASDSVGWSTETHDPITGRPILRLLVTATDAPVHDPVFYNEQAKLNLPRHNFSSPEGRDALHKDINVGCNQTDYPTAEDIRHVFEERKITPIIFSGVNYRITEEGKKQQFIQYQQMLERYGQSKGPWADLETGLAAYYSWFMKEQLQMDGVVEKIDSTSSNFIDVFRVAMEQVKELTCIPTTTSTPVPEKPTDPIPPTRPSTTSTTSTATAITSNTGPSTATTTADTAGSTTTTTTTASGSTTTTTTTASGSTTTTTTTASGHVGVIIGSAAGGAAIAAAAAGLILAQKFGLAGFGGSSPVDTSVIQDVDNVEITQEREQFESVTQDHFS